MSVSSDGNSRSGSLTPPTSTTSNDNKFVSEENLAYYHSKIKEAVNFAQEEYNKSLNKVYISSSNLEATSEGITNTLNADGSINCVGTCTSNYFNISKTTPCYIPAGTYALSVNKTLTKYSLFMRVAYSDGTTGQMAIWKNNKSNVLTFSKDVISYSFFAGEVTSGSAINDTLYIQLQEGSVVSSYQPYNASKQITNNQADFLKEEYNKGLNLFDANVSYRFSSYNDYISTGEGSVSLKDVGSNSTYAVSETKYTLDQFVFKATFSNDYPRYLFVPYDANGNVMKDLTINGLKSYNSVYKAYYVDSQYLSLTKPSNVAYFKLGFVITSGTATQQIVGVSNMILVEGSDVPSAYTPYQGGEIVRKGDIEPVLLWKNGSPNSALDEVIITTSQNYSDYEELIAVYKEYNGSEFIPRYIRFKIVANGKLTILGHTGNSAYNNILRRTIWLYNNTNQIYIYGGKVSESGTTDNNAIILLEFLGVPN